VDEVGEVGHRHLGIYKRRSDPLTSKVLGNHARRIASAPSIIISKWAFTWALTVVEDPRVGMFCHFSIQSDFSMLVHFVAPTAELGTPTWQTYLYASV
jgi:hypothetical protein